MNPVVNDFTIRVATVNGSGSQTANQILMKSFFRMNIPVGSKNFFPSNIQGMPTWFDIRVNQQGFVGAKFTYDILINYNPKSLKEDIAALKPTGVLFYDKDSVLPVELPTAQAFALPFKKLLEETHAPLKYRKALGNMIYVGALSAYLKIPQEILLSEIERQFKTKEAVSELNKKAALLSRQFFATNYADQPARLQARALPKSNDKVLMDGNTAAAMGLLYGGCSFVSWYPITPSTSVIETFKEMAAQYRIREVDGSSRQVLVQAEDELSAICMVLGAGWAGSRALTATSGPGLSLMAEAAGYAYYAEIPAVIWNVQRTGPSTGLPTRTAQGDITFAHFLSHGDTKHVCLIPGTLRECFEFGQTCFNLAERLQTLVIVLSDLDLGMNLWVDDKWNYPERPFDRGKIMALDKLEQGQPFARYHDLDNDGIPYRTLPGTPHAKAAYFTRGSGHNTQGQYTEIPSDYQEVIDRLLVKWEHSRALVPPPLIKNHGAVHGLIYYGALDEVIAETQSLLKEKICNTCRVRALPFTTELEDFLQANQKVYVVDQNRDGQMFQLLAMEYPQFAAKLISLRSYNGLPVNAEKLAKDLTHA